MTFVATLQFDRNTTATPPRPFRVSGAAELSFAVRHGATTLAHLYQKDPVRVLFPAPARGDIATAVLVTTSGGLVGGDVISTKVSIGAGASALVTMQAAEKLYRSAGEDCHIAVDLHAEPESWSEWLPQETIIFDGGRMRRATRINISGNARVMAGEMLVFGRTAMGERLHHGLVRDSWEVRRDGSLNWADALHMDDHMEDILASPAGFDGAVAMATAIYAADDASDHLDLAREILSSYEAGTSLRTGATMVNGVLIARWLARDAFRMRRSYGDFWARLRAAANDLPAQLPRLWHV
jgi:urease accessory protein